MALLFLGLVLAFFGGTASQSTVFQIDLNAPSTPWDHYWSRCVGSGHMLLTTRQDYRAHLTQCQKELGFEYVRGHGLFDDDMSTSMGPGLNSYYNVDSYIDFLLSINMKPVLELSFMPTWLASGNATVTHYKGNITPPSNYEAWGEIVGSLAQHLVARYGINTVSQFYFEVWNEPGGAPTFWTGSEADYFELYNVSARAIKAVSPLLKVGGPATDYCTCWITDFINYCKTNNVPYDFISTHCYSGGDSNVGSVSAVVSGLQQARALMGESIPFLVTEWSSTYIQGDGQGSTAGDYHDSVDQAAFLLSAVDQAYGLPTFFSYWAFSDVFEEMGFPTANLSFHGGFGLLNLYQVPKPTYRAFQLLNEGGFSRVNSSMVSSSGTCSNTTGVIATRNTTTSPEMLLLVFYNHAEVGASISDCSITVSFSGLSSYDGATMRRIDSQNANPLQTWIDIGMPQYPDSAEIAAMLTGSQLNPTSINLTSSFSFDLPAHGTVAISLPLE